MELLLDVLHELQGGRLPSLEILSLLFTRFVGYGLTIFACFLKVPQILRVARNKSAEGLSISAFELEVFICAIHTAYGYTNGFHASLYGEALAIMTQCIVLISFIYYYSGVSMKRPIFTFGLLVAWAVYVLSGETWILLVLEDESRGGYNSGGPSCVLDESGLFPQCSDSPDLQDCSREECEAIKYGIIWSKHHWKRNSSHYIFERTSLCFPWFTYSW